MKFLLKLALALTVGVVCVYLVLRGVDLPTTWDVLKQVSLPAVGLYVIILALTHVLRVSRWADLLAPIRVRLPFKDLFVISSVGFMAIQALPVRLGEFVRPYFVVRSGRSRMSAVLGTVAVERIVDGLLIPIIFFASYWVSDHGAWSPELELAAWISLLGFVGAMLFLAGALRFPQTTIRVALMVTLLPWLSPRLAHKAQDKLRALIGGFQVLHEPRHLLSFLLQSVLYWGLNGFGMWLLARGMGLPVSLVAAFAAMSFTGVIISLPNSPGLVGQFHLGVVTALAAYLSDDVAVRSAAVAYATLLHGIQLIWYCLMGFLCLPFLPGGRRSLRQVVVESSQAAQAVEPGPGSAEPRQSQGHGQRHGQGHDQDHTEEHGQKRAKGQQA